MNWAGGQLSQHNSNDLTTQGYDFKAYCYLTLSSNIYASADTDHQICKAEVSLKISGYRQNSYPHRPSGWHVLVSQTQWKSEVVSTSQTMYVYNNKRNSILKTETSAWKIGLQLYQGKTKGNTHS